MLPVSCS